MNHALDEAILLQTRDRASQMRRECAVTRALAKMDSEDAEEMRAVLENRAVWNTTIVTLLERRGVQTSEKTVRFHRAGRCGCPK